MQRDATNNRLLMTLFYAAQAACAVSTAAIGYFFIVKFNTLACVALLAP
jgi:hypothetical protein